MSLNKYLSPCLKRGKLHKAASLQLHNQGLSTVQPSRAFVAASHQVDSRELLGVQMLGQPYLQTQTGGDWNRVHHRHIHNRSNWTTPTEANEAWNHTFHFSLVLDKHTKSLKHTTLHHYYEFPHSPSAFLIFSVLVSPIFCWLFFIFVDFLPTPSTTCSSLAPSSPVLRPQPGPRSTCLPSTHIDPTASCPTQKASQRLWEYKATLHNRQRKGKGHLCA